MAKTRVKAFQDNASASQPSKPIRLTLRTGVGYEYHVVMEEQAVRDLLDPDVSDAFIPVPVKGGAQGVKVRYVHTSTIAEVDLNDDLPAPQVG